ncbi:MAG TPA: SIR2 family protein [Anaerolineales bacterium]|nr:SIR2 family protein [Anaerolineales bacterium]
MPSENSNKELDYLINEIAGCLIKNHLKNSLEQSEWDILIKDDVLKDRIERRVLAIVGAGASKIAGLPLANEALKKLKDEASMPSKALEAELERLTQIYKLDRDAFETYLRALSTSVFEAQKLRDNLQKMYGHRFMPVLSYEILAHMLKHRFLDAIINFNFDELLDQSIEDELDPEEYYHILSDGDCPDEGKLRETYPELPFYIKPHGTAGYKSTLRFTREDYYGLPFDIQRVLRYLLTEKPVVLLIIGFGMQSFEFNHILEDAHPDSRMYHINLKNPVKNTHLAPFSCNRLLDIKTLDGVNGALRKIWESVRKGFQEEYKPRDITRHILITQTFFHDINDYNVERYLQGRTIIELCLSIAKGSFAWISSSDAKNFNKFFNLIDQKINQESK